MSDRDPVTAPAAPLYDYEFSVWPDQYQQPAFYRLFTGANRHVETMTAAGFGGFRLQLEAGGLTLREITRVPSVTPEIVL